MRAGTDFRINQIVRGTCEVCGAEDVLLYAPYLDTLPDVLMCADDSRKRAVANPPAQTCDVCGAWGNVWRDPVGRKNVYLCIKHHDTDAIFQNRWARFEVRESVGLGIRAKATCEVGNSITECKGEVRWRSAFNMSICNKHAGKKSANEANN